MTSGSDNWLPAVLTDFDDTAAEQNVAHMLLTRFGDPTWQEVRGRFQAGELTLSEYQEITFRNIQASRSTMQDYVKRHANLRPYFKELWAYCQAHEIPMAVVSQGLDFYIEALLEREGFPWIPVYAVNTTFTPQGISYEYPYARPGEERQGNSKGLIVDGYRQRGYFVFYAGDGISDFEAASRANMLFAHRTLAEECLHRQIPFRPFRDFEDVLLALQAYRLDGCKAGPGPVTPPSGSGGQGGLGEGLP